MSKTLKQIRAGRLGMAVIYTTPTAGDPERVRGQKCKASSAARERLNARTSFAKLERTLAANFDDGDILLTCTFDEKHRPESREQAMRRARSFFTRLRAARKARGQPLRYIYVIEGCRPGGRGHIHAVVNATGEDLREFKEQWRYGHEVELRRLTFSRDYTYEELASYLTKEPREWGHPHVGERNWIPSLGLEQPEPERERVPDSVTLTAPPGAEVLSREGPVVNGYGEYAWVKYLMPAGTRKKPKPRARRTRRPKGRE